MDAETYRAELALINPPREIGRLHPVYLQLAPSTPMRHNAFRFGPPRSPAGYLPESMTVRLKP